MNYDAYIEKCDGDWNNPYINSEVLNLVISGYAPKLRGGCMGIIPNNNMLLILGEDDDNYFDICNITIEDAKDLRYILKKLSKDITVVIDYTKAVATTDYKLSREDFFNNNYSHKDFNVNIKDRGDKVAPLVEISNNTIKFNMIFDISWAKEKYSIFNKALKLI